MNKTVDPALDREFKKNSVVVCFTAQLKAHVEMDT